MAKDIFDITFLPQEEAIDSFLRGKMDPNEEVAFLERLKNDEELQQKAVATSRIIRGLNSEGMRHDHEVKRIMKDYDSLNFKKLIEGIVFQVEELEREMGGVKYRRVRPEDMFPTEPENDTNKKGLLPSGHGCLIWILAVIALSGLLAYCFF